MAMDQQPKIKPIRHDQLTALLDAGPRRTEGTTVQSRKRKEKAPLVKASDGRRLKSKGRDKQFNTNVTPDLNDNVADFCDRFGITKADFTEFAFRAAIALLQSSGVEGLKAAAGEPLTDA